MWPWPRLFWHTPILLCALSQTVCSVRSSDVALAPAVATSSPPDDLVVKRAVTFSECEESGDALRQCNTADQTTDVFRPDSSSTAPQDAAAATAWSSTPELLKSATASLETISPLFQTIGKALRGTSSGNSLVFTSRFLHQHRRELRSLPNLQAAIARSDPSQNSERLLALRSLRELHSSVEIYAEPGLLVDIVKVLLHTSSSPARVANGSSSVGGGIHRGYDAEISPLALTVLRQVFSDMRRAWLMELLVKGSKHKLNHLTAEQLLETGTPISSRFHSLRRLLRPLVPQIADIVLSKNVQPDSDTVTIEQGLGLLYELLAEFSPGGLQDFFSADPLPQGGNRDLTDLAAYLVPLWQLPEVLGGTDNLNRLRSFATPIFRYSTGSSRTFIERVADSLLNYGAVFGYVYKKQRASLMILGGEHNGQYLMQPIRAAWNDGADGRALLAVPLGLPPGVA